MRLIEVEERASPPPGPFPDLYCHARGSPARAANPPRIARKSSELPETRGIKPVWGATIPTTRGMSAPATKLAADANAA
jgi:hypothetical protein